MKDEYKKPWLYLLAISFLAFLMFNFIKYDSYIQICLDGQKYSLFISLSQGYIEYKGIKYSLLSEKKYTLIDIAIGDIDCDGRDNILILEGREKSNYADTLIVYDADVKPNGLQIKESYRNNMGAVRPWKIEICEIDNDDELEIFIAVNKATRIYPDIENRPFFFNFKNNMLVKKWTGSKLRAPFTDICFIDLNGNGSDELIAIEEIEKDKFVIAVYYWFGFGFILQGESHIYDKISFIEVERINTESFIKAKVKENDTIKTVILEPSANKTKNEIYLLRERGK